MPNINRVVHFEIQADDVSRAEDFYKKVFGWKMKMMPKVDKEDEDYIQITTGPEGTPGINGGLYERPVNHQVHAFHCTIGVPDIDKAILAINKSGGIIRSAKNKIPGIGWVASAIDTEGNSFGLIQETTN